MGENHEDWIESYPLLWDEKTNSSFLSGFLLCWDGTNFSVQSRFRFRSCRFMVPFLIPRFLFLILNTRVSVQGYLHFSHYGASSVPFWLHINSKSGGTLSFGIGTYWLEPKLLKIFGTKIKKLRFFGIFGYGPTLLFMNNENIHVDTYMYRC